jgi:hypothetical protein
MAKKTRSMRRAENARESAAPKVPNSTPVATVTAPKVPPSTNVASAQSQTTNAKRTARPTRTSETAPRLTSADLARDMAFVRYDLRRIGILASTIFALLIALALILPRVMG